MTEREQIIHFSNDLDKLVDRYRSEYELTYASTIGALQMKIHTLIQDAINSGEDPQDETP